MKLVLRKIKAILKELNINIVGIIYIFEQQKEISLKKLINFVNFKNIILGFTSEKRNIYNLKNYELKDYLSDFSRMKTFKINGKYSIILEDKVIFEKILKEQNVCPLTYGEIKNGKLFLNKKEKKIKELVFLLEQQKKIVLKPISGGGGKGIVILEFENKKILYNKKEILEKDLEKKMNSFKEYIISECLENGTYLKTIYDGTLNTVRIVTMLNPKTKEPFIAAAVQRIGSSTTYPVDNVWNGGYTSKINISNGKLEKMAYHTNNNREIKWNCKHKDTGKTMEGIIIKNWDQVKEKILSLSKELNTIPYIGWDVLIQEAEVKIIEANNYSDVNFIQIHEPLLIKKEVKEFYKYHKII